MPQRHSDPSVTQQVKFDAVCMQFEQAWRQGERPEIESFLEGLPESERSQLLTQLLLLELEYLQQAGDIPSSQHYVDRFPKEHQAVRYAFAEHASALPAAILSENVEPAGTLDQQSTSEHLGSQIGRYKLLEQIGEGGMGVVYMAEQQRPVRRKVALKIIKPGMDTKQVVARFEAERQALAMMDHPNIARVLDGGSTDSGRPYFVMELVRGVTVTEYCDQNKLDTNDRLGLFKSVCQAVQHAHTKGIIHRDLKPTNVLVTLHDGVPVPKIIDFGVSKAMGQQLTDRTMFTAFAQMIGTPLYMSPEQAEMSGLDIDTRSDIYSLGVLLYELLTGVTPFDRQRLHTAAFDELRRIIREEEPEKPSTRVSSLGESSATVSASRSTDPGKLKQLLRGELDWIVMKALEKDRNRRYETANALVAEVDRYLSGEPVEACPPSTTYRLRKFARRYQKQVSVAASFLTILLVSSIVAWLLYVDARRARNDAVAAKDSVTVERDRARDAERQASLERDRTAAEKRRADQHSDELKLRLYDYNIIKAQAAFDEKDYEKVQNWLADCPAEQRGWEWHRIDRLTSGERKIRLPDSAIVGADASPIEPRIAVLDNDSNLRLCDLADGRTIWMHKSEVTGPAFILFSPAGRLIAVYTNPFSAGSRLEIWSADGEKVWSTSCQPRGVGFVAFSPDDRYFSYSTIEYSPKLTSVVEIHESNDPKPMWNHAFEGFAVMGFDHAAKHLFLTLATSDTMTDPSTLCCWSINEPREIWSITRSNVGLPCSTPDGFLLTGGLRHSLEIREPSSGELIGELASSATDVAYYLRFSPDGKKVISLGEMGQTVVWDWGTKLPSVVSIGGNRESFPGFTHDSKYIVKTTDSFVELQSAEEEIAGEIVLSGHEKAVCGVAFSTDGKHVISTSFDGTLRKWNATTGQEIQTKTIDRFPTAVALSSNGEHIATGGRVAISLWSAKSGLLLHQWPDPESVISLKFSSDSKHLMAGNLQNGLRMFDVSSGEEIFTQKTVYKIGGVALSKDGQRAFSLGYQTGQIDIWDLDAGNAPNTPVAFRQPGGGFSYDLLRIHRISNASKGNQTGNSKEPSGVVAAAIGPVIELWDVETGRQLNTLRGHDGDVICLAAIHDGSRIFSGDDLGVVKVWNFDTGEQLLTMQAHASQIVPNWGSSANGVMSMALSPDETTLATTGADGLVKLWETTHPSPQLTHTRRVVKNGTNLVNELYHLHNGSLRGVMTALANHESSEQNIRQLAMEIASVRGDRTAGPMMEISAVQDDQPHASDVFRSLRRTEQMVVALVEVNSGIDVDQKRVNTPLSDGIDWYFEAQGLADQFSQPENQGLLNLLISGYPDAHHFVYLRGLGSGHCGRWRDAERDLTASLARVPEKSAIWHTQAYHLAILHLFLGDVAKYRTLCERMLADFGDSDDPILAERTGQLCFLSPESVLNLERPAALVGLATADNEHELFPWFSFTKALAEYRRGATENALANLEIAEKHPHSNLRAKAFCLKALCLQEAEKPALAREALAAAESITESDSFPQLDGDEFPFWSDWIIVQLVKQEAAKHVR